MLGGRGLDFSFKPFVIRIGGVRLASTSKSLVTYAQKRKISIPKDASDALGKIGTLY